MITRTDVINTLAHRYQYQSYLEIGVADSENFDAIRVGKKVGVDPSPNVNTTHRLTSDEFFDRNSDRFDLIFIDGLHERKQVNRDINNSLESLRHGGTIVMHDCNPLMEEFQRMPRVEGSFDPWTGDVWKSVAQLRMCRPNLSVYVIDTDWGCGIVRPGSQILYPEVSIGELTYEYLDKHRADLLNLVSPTVWHTIISS